MFTMNAFFSRGTVFPPRLISKKIKSVRDSEDGFFESDDADDDDDFDEGREKGAKGKDDPERGTRKILVDDQRKADRCRRVRHEGQQRHCGRGRWRGRRIRDRKRQKGIKNNRKRNTNF